VHRFEQWEERRFDRHLARVAGLGRLDVAGLVGGAMDVDVAAFDLHVLPSERFEFATAHVCVDCNDDKPLPPQRHTLTGDENRDFARVRVRPAAIRSHVGPLHVSRWVVVADA